MKKQTRVELRSQVIANPQRVRQSGEELHVADCATLDVAFPFISDVVIQ